MLFCRKNSAVDFATNRDFKVKVFYNGNIVWLPDIDGETHCKVDLANFPFDTQVCEWLITSIGYSNTDI